MDIKHTFSKLKLHAGFTIMELVIYIALMSVLIMVISRIFISALDVQIQSEAVSSVDQDGRFLLSRLQYDISQADEVLVPAAFGEPSESLVLRKNGVNTLYDLTGDVFEITDDVDTQRLNSIGTKVSGLSFTKIGNPTGKPTIQIEFTLRSAVEEAGGPETKDFKTTIGLR